MRTAVVVLVLLPLLACAPRAPSDPLGRFPLGVASGDVTFDGAVLWTRYDGDEELRVRLWLGRDGVEEQVASIPVAPADGGFARVRVEDLAPSTEYHYAFEAGGAVPAQSRTGRFRTAPVPGAAERLILDVVSCARNGADLGILERAAELPVDAVLYLGDTVYADGATDLDGYRAKWAQNLGTEGMAALRAAASGIATWDDHEVGNNWAGDNVDAERLAAAVRAFHEHVPVAIDPEHPERLWRKLRWGATEVFVLDSRSERRPQTRSTAEAEYLSEAQLSWLEQGLAASSAVFKVVMNSVPISDFPSLFDAAAGDRWEGYPAQRERLLRFIEEQQLTGVIFVAGDFHLGSLGKVAPAGARGEHLLEVVVGPAANFTNSLAATLAPPQFDWARDVNNHARLHLDPLTRTVRVTFHGEDGRILADRTYAPAGGAQ